MIQCRCGAGIRDVSDRVDRSFLLFPRFPRLLSPHWGLLGPVGVLLGPIVLIGGV